MLDIYRPLRKKIACRRINKGVKAHASTGLTPQILCTCKAINQEATAILYGENTFQFRLNVIHPPWDYNVTKKEVHRYLDQEVHAKLLYCKNEKADSALFRCDLAVFLRQVGQLNAASLKKLKIIRQEKAWQYHELQETGWTIAMVARLLKCHTPAVTQIKICLTSVLWDEFENGPFQLVEDEVENNTRTLDMWDSDDESDWDYPFDARLSASENEQEALFNGIGYLVEKVPSLKQLRVTGFNKSHRVYQKIQKLQAWVSNRP